jgi:hypothetical protein
MKSPRIMFFYAGFLFACGIIAFLMAADRTRAMTALYMTGAAALLMIVCGVFARLINVRRAVAMAAIHIGMVLPVIYGIAFSMLAYRRFTTQPPTTYLAVIFTIMAIASVIAFIAILRTRPAMEKRV